MPEPTPGQEWTDADITAFVSSFKPVARTYILNNIPNGLSTPNFRTWVRIVDELKRQVMAQGPSVAIN